jgi:hypothetical protein
MILLGHVVGGDHRVGYNIEGKSYWIVTDRLDLLAEQVGLVHKLRWDIENISHGGNGTSKFIIFLLEVRIA